MAKAQAVAIKEEPGPMIVPDFMRAQAGLGHEALSASDVEVPRVKLMQAISPELEENNDLKAGDFFHTLADLNLGPIVRITPIFIDQRYVLWRPRETGGGILARADDGIHWSPPNTEFQVKLKSGQDVTWRTANTVAQSGLSNWGSSNPADANSPPAATRMYNVVVALADHPELPPAVVTLQRAAIKVARRFLGKMKITRAPSFGLIFSMRSTSEQGPGGKFYNYQFVADGMVTDKETYERNFDAYKYFKSQGINVKDLEGAQDDDLPTDNGADDKPAAGSPKF